MADILVTRLYHELVTAIREQRPGDPDKPVTVAEIYQNLVPYRTARAALGVELNADYEHALLRLLSGEGDLVRLEPPDAREELRREAESDNPNVGLFRKFAACDVHVDLDVAVPAGPADGTAAAGAAPTAPAGLEAAGDRAAAFDDTEAAAAETGAAAAREAAHSAESAPADGGAIGGVEAGEAGAMHGAARLAEAVAAAVSAHRRDRPADRGPALAESSAAPAPRDDRCAFCEQSLPSGRDVRFCPFCGEDRSRRPCTACDDVLESGWRFCATCGAPAPDA